MKLLLVIALVAFGYWKYTQDQSAKGAFDAAGKPAIHFYTSAQCGKVCADAEALLTQKRVPFERIEVDLNAGASGAGNARWEKQGLQRVPLLVAGKEFAVATAPQEMTRVLGKTFGDAYFTAFENKYFDRHFNAQGKPQIVMYSASWCPYCTQLRQQLNESGTPFIEIDADASVDKSRLREALQVRGYPTVYVGYEMVRNGGDVRQVKSVYSKASS